MSEITLGGQVLKHGDVAGGERTLREGVLEVDRTPQLPVAPQGEAEDGAQPARLDQRVLHEVAALHRVVEPDRLCALLHHPHHARDEHTACSA